MCVNVCVPSILNDVTVPYSSCYSLKGGLFMFKIFFVFILFIGKLIKLSNYYTKHQFYGCIKADDVLFIILSPFSLTRLWTMRLYILCPICSCIFKQSNWQIFLLNSLLQLVAKYKLQLQVINCSCKLKRSYQLNIWEKNTFQIRIVAWSYLKQDLLQYVIRTRISVLK